MHLRVGVLVLAHNAADTLAGTLDRIPPGFRDRIDELVLLDDASTDDTFPIAAEWARRHHFVPAVVLRHTKRLGYGGSRKAACRLALEHGLDVIVLLPADGSAPPESMPILIRPLLDETADAVIGVPGAPDVADESRCTKVIDGVLSRLNERVLGTPLTGLRSVYRAYSTAALREIPFEANSDGPDFDTQLFMQFAHEGKRVVEAQVNGAAPTRAGGLGHAAAVVRDLHEYRHVTRGVGTSGWVPAPEDIGFKEGSGTSHDALLAALTDFPASRVLDLGCGSGRFAQRARALGHRVVGVDRTEFDGVRDRLNLFVRADLNTGIPQQAHVAAGYDVVVAADVLQHLVHPDRLLREIRNVLRPGGQVLVCVPNGVHWYARLRFASGRFDYDRRGLLDVDHLRFFTRRSLRRMAARAGYDVLGEQVGGLPSRGRRALARVLPNLFADQLIIRLTPHSGETIGAPSLADEVFSAHYGAVPRQQERRRQDA
jgi:2-polyprenyl-3-methyl-5-hydroxy-6-metoxy-1,4-benzoquinol methylase